MFLPFWVGTFFRNFLEETMASKYQHVIDYMKDIPCFNSQNKILLTVLEDDYAEGRVELDCYSMNTNGHVHGGLLYSASDYIGGFAACRDDKACVTESGSINYLRPGTGDYLTVKAWPVKIGKKVAVVDVSVFDDRERLLTKGTFTYFFMTEDF
jgi:acyl-CoA thioesterase